MSGPELIATRVRVVSSRNGELLVEPAEQSGCSGCGSRSVCGISGLAKHFAGARKPVAISCGADLRPGEELQLQMSEGDLLKVGLLAYLLPSLLAICGAAAATQSGYGDGIALLGAAAGMAAGLLLARAMKWSPRIAVGNFK